MFFYSHLSARGKASTEASGLITAIADQAAKIHPNSNAPVVILESADRWESLIDSLEAWLVLHYVTRTLHAMYLNFQLSIDIKARILHRSSLQSKNIC